MPITISLLGLILALLPGGGPQRGWMQVTVRAGRFTVQMPGPPRTTMQKLNGPKGTITAFMAVLNQGDAGYADFPGEFNNDVLRIMNKLMEGVGAPALRENGSTLSRRKISLHGMPGREIVTRGPKGGIVCTPWYVSGRRMYLLVAVGRTETTAPDTVRFFNSFQLLTQ